VIRAYIGVGANLGDPLQALRSAREALQGSSGIQLTGSSPIYRSAPVGPAGQPDYLNAVLAVDTTLSPHELLSRLQAIEDQAGRLRAERWGARCLDLDLLLHGDAVIDTPRLQLPHPQLYRRNFVLLPLADLCPREWRFPDGSSITERCAACPPNPIERTGLDWHTAPSDSASASGTAPWQR
jgi:2-amino-4-hydroxy-6-hydroxymethyldihydropteridine diphosphokinase